MQVALRGLGIHFGGDAVDEVDEFLVGLLLQPRELFGGLDVFGMGVQVGVGGDLRERLFRVGVVDAVILALGKVGDVQCLDSFPLCVVDIELLAEPVERAEVVVVLGRRGSCTCTTPSTRMRGCTPCSR